MYLENVLDCDSSEDGPLTVACIIQAHSKDTYIYCDFLF